MVKRESAKRGYMTLAEVEGHLDKFKYDSQKENYLDRILSKKKLLNPKTEESVREYFAKKAQEEWKSYPFPTSMPQVERLLEKGGAEKHPELYEKIAISAAKKGYFNWADSLMKKAGIESLKVYKMMKEYSEREGKIANEMMQSCLGSGKDYSAGKWSDEAQHQAKTVTRLKHKLGGLENATATASIVGILGGLFFLSPNMTGNAIGNMTTQTASWIGAVLIVIGIIALYFLMKARKRKNNKKLNSAIL